MQRIIAVTLMKSLAVTSAMSAAESSSLSHMCHQAALAEQQQQQQLCSLASEEDPISSRLADDDESDDDSDADYTPYPDKDEAAAFFAGDFLAAEVGDRCRSIRMLTRFAGLFGAHAAPLRPVSRRAGDFERRFVGGIGHPSLGPARKERED